MPMPPRQETAKIYQFPVKGRTAVPDHRTAPPPVAANLPVVATDFGSGWYHEAAMQDTHQGRKH